MRSAWNPKHRPTGSPRSLAGSPVDLFVFEGLLATQAYTQCMDTLLIIMCVITVGIGLLAYDELTREGTFLDGFSDRMRGRITE